MQQIFAKEKPFSIQTTCLLSRVQRTVHTRAMYIHVKRHHGLNCQHPWSSYIVVRRVTTAALFQHLREVEVQLECKIQFHGIFYCVLIIYMLIYFVISRHVYTCSFTPLFCNFVICIILPHIHYYIILHVYTTICIINNTTATQEIWVEGMNMNNRLAKRVPSSLSRGTYNSCTCNTVLILNHF